MKHSWLQGTLNRRAWLLGAIALLLPLGLFAIRATRRVSPGANSQLGINPFAKARVLAAYGKLPLTFEQNQGQTDPRVKFLAHGNGYTLFLTDGEAVLRLRAPAGRKGVARKYHANSGAPKFASGGDSVVRLALVAANPASQAEGLEIQSGHSNYLIGNDSSRWQRNVALYGRVKYRDVYPGIDAVYYGNQDRLECDYIVAPSANPNRIALQVNGARTLALDPNGDLVIASAAGELKLHRPRVYQEIDGTRREIAANYVARSNNSVGIHVGSYDSHQPLIVDPVLDYSTYLGGTGGEFLYGIAADSSGNAYVTGYTTATNFPTTMGAYLTTFGAGATSYAFVTKINPSGTGLVFSTFLGGTLSGQGNGIAVDSTGNVFVAGTTSASDFPFTPNAFQTSAPNGGVFMTELDPTGSILEYSTYLAGASGLENAVGLALDANDNAYVLGRTSDTNFPITAGAYQTSNNTDQSDPDRGTNFLSRINPAQVGTASLIYSTYLGGTTAEFPTSVAVDANENAYITGNTSSIDYPTVNAYLSSQNNKYGDAFISRIDTTQSGQSSLIYSTYFGGPSNGFGTASDVGGGIAVQPNSVAVVVGYTYALAGQFPTTANALETASDAPNAIAFLSRFDTTKSGSSSLLYASTWGGSTTDLAFAVTLDSADNIYMVGATHDTNFPVTPGAPLSASPGAESAFLSEFNPTGTTSLFSTYWGGSVLPGSAAYAVAVDSASPPNAYFAGITASTFPTTSGAFQTTFKATGSSSDGFVAKMSPGAVTGVFATPAVLSFGSVVENTASPGKTVTLFNETQSALTIGVNGITVTGTNASDFGQVNNCPLPGSTLAAGASCTITVTFTPTTTSSETATLSIADSDTSSPQTVSLSGTGTTPPPGVTLTPSPLNIGNVNQGSNSSQSITLLNNSSSPLTITSISIVGTTDFTQTNTCPASPSTLAASGGYCTINVTFAPTATGNETATLTVVDSDPSSPQSDTLTGTGVAPAGSVTVAPTSIAFGNVNINATSPAQTVTLTNGKTTTLTITSVTIAGANASDFAAGSKCGTSLAANSSCTISVTFTPTMVAAESATLTLTDSDSTSPQTIALSGTGIAALPDFTIAASPTSATVGTHGIVTTLITVTSIAGFSSPVTLSACCVAGRLDNYLLAESDHAASERLHDVDGDDHDERSYVHRRAHIIATSASSANLALDLRGFCDGSRCDVEDGRTRRAGRACAFALLSLVAMASCTGTPSTPAGRTPCSSPARPAQRLTRSNLC